jgi:hypothetical protein
MSGRQGARPVNGDWTSRSGCHGTSRGFSLVSLSSGSLGLWEGSTENATVATALLSDLVERGLDPEQGILFVIDGAKALAKLSATGRP